MLMSISQDDYGRGVSTAWTCEALRSCTMGKVWKLLANVIVTDLLANSGCLLRCSSSQSLERRTPFKVLRKQKSGNQVGGGL
jgi:hypothetical protein